MTTRRGFFGTCVAALASVVSKRPAKASIAELFKRNREQQDGGIVVPEEYAKAIERSLVSVNTSRLMLHCYAYASVEDTPQLVGKVRVLLDGKELPNCDAANAREGWARVIERDSGGRLVLTKDQKDVVRTVLHGQVEILRKERC